jgi:hypothetical protein
MAPWGNIAARLLDNGGQVREDSDMNKLLFVLAGAFLCGCVSAPPAPKLSTTRLYSAPKDRVWPLIVAEIAPKYSTKAIEKASGLLTTDVVSIPGDLNGFGDWPICYRPRGMFLPVWSELRMNMTVLASEPEPGKTSVSITIHYEAFESNATKSWVICESNGRLEDQILNAIGAKL